MATTEEAKIIVKMEAETKRLQTKLDQAEKKVKRFETTTKKSVRGISDSFKGLLAGVAIGTFAKKVLDVSSSMQVLKSRLETVEGSSEKASKAFELIKDFAAETPFRLDEVTDSFIKLKALGLEPSERALASYGNTASAMGKSLNQLIEAVADASTGEFERLKEFGIKSRSEGDKVVFTFQGIETEVEKAAGAIQNYLIGIGETQFAGSMERQANTVSGALSTLQDNFDNLLANEEGIDDLTGSIQDFSDVLKDPAVVDAVNALAKAVVVTATAFVNLTAASTNFVKSMAEDFARFTSGPADVAGVLDDLESRFNSSRFSGGFNQEVFDKEANIIKQLSGFESVEEIEANLNKVKTLITEVGAIKDKSIGTKRDKEVIDKQFLGLLEIEASLEEALNKAASFKPPEIKTPSEPKTPKPIETGVNFGKKGGSKKEKDPFAQSLSQVQSLLESIRSPLQEYTDNVAILDSLVLAGRLGQDDYNLAFSEYKRQLEEATPGIQNMQELTQAITDTLPAEEAALAAVRQQMLDLNLAMEQFPEKADAITSALINLQEEEARLIEKSKETGEELSEFGKEAARNIQNELGDTLRSTLEGDFDGILDSWGNMLAEMGYQLIAQNFADAFDLESLFSSGGSSKGGGLSSFFGGFFADGGRPGVGKLNVVGERGPELFVPDSAGTIIPNDALGGGQQFSFGDVVLQGVNNESEGRKAAGAFMNETARLIDNAQRYK